MSWSAPPTASASATRAPRSTEQVAAMAAIAARQKAEGGPPITMTISVAFGCPFDGEVSEDQVIAIVRAAAEAGVGRDRAGRHHRRRRPLAGAPPRRGGPQGRGRQPACACTSTTPATPAWPTPSPASRPASTCWTPAVGGLGGCPFAPDATGNIGTEDLVYMLERAGFETGYDLDGLITTASGWPASSASRRPPRSAGRAAFPRP